MRCGFELLQNHISISEEALTKSLLQGDDTCLRNLPWSGRLTLQDVGMTLVIEDELSAIMHNLGLALAEAMQNQRACYRYFELHGVINIDIREEIIGFEGDFVAGNPHFFAEEALPALLDCIQRYMALLALAQRFLPDLETEVAILQKSWKRAQSILDARFTTLH